MHKYVFVVPNIEGNIYKINKYYLEKISKYNIPYIICDYNIKNLNFNYIKGILLTGGGDIEPSLYKQKNIKSKDISLLRDKFEIYILRKALKYNIPVFAICRGMQIMNVAFGGNLYQNIRGHMQRQGKKVPTHNVNIDKNSNLYNILNIDKIMVNSFHHQAIKTPAKCFDVVAKKGNIIEAIEYKDKDKFFMGVQWHPEALSDSYSDKLFSYFLNFN